MSSIGNFQTLHIEAGIRARASSTEAAYVEWLGEVQMTADEAMAATHQQPAPTDQADAFLKELLRNGPLRQKEVVQRGRDKGLSEDQLKRARSPRRS
jgi:hypothetical protein